MGRCRPLPADMVALYDDWGTSQSVFDSTNLRLGILNISAGRRTTAEIGLLLAYRDSVTSEATWGIWAGDTLWRWATRDLSKRCIDAQSLAK